MESLFDDARVSAERHGLMARVSAFVAPVAANAGSVIADAAALDLADAVYEAFGDLDADGGLSRAQVAAACADICPDPTRFDSRFDLFCRLGMLLPVRDKAHQQRYVFNPTSAAALMVFERLGRDGGVQEILTLLDRTRVGLRSGVVTAEQVERALAQARRGFAVNTDHLSRMVTSAPLEDLLAERRHHRSGDALLTEARDLIALVVGKFPALAVVGDRLIREAVRYSQAVQRFIGRLLEEATAHRDFSMLDAEQYLTAALTADREALAGAFAQALFDPANPPVNADGIVAAIDAVVPHQPRRRAPRPADPPLGDDPVALAQERVERAKQRRMLTAELGLDGEPSADVTTALRLAGWPGAALMVAELLAAHADPDLPYAVELSRSLIVDPPGIVTHVSPVTVARLPVPLSAPGHPSAAAPIASSV
jgi:CBS domain-containing protein